MDPEGTNHEPEGFAQLRRPPAPHGTYVEALRGVALFSGPAAEAVAFSEPQRRSLRYRHPLSSVYLDRSGTVHVLRPHTHVEVARKVLRATHPDLNVAGLPNAQQALLLLSGIVRAQIYDDGVGVSLDMAHPPSAAQVGTLRDLHALAGGGPLVAEVLCEAELLGRLKDAACFEAFVSAAHLGEVGAEPVAKGELLGLVEELSHGIG